MRNELNKLCDRDILQSIIASRIGDLYLHRIPQDQITAEIISMIAADSADLVTALFKDLGLASSLTRDELMNSALKLFENSPGAIRISTGKETTTIVKKKKPGEPSWDA